MIVTCPLLIASHIARGFIIVEDDIYTITPVAQFELIEVGLDHVMTVNEWKIHVITTPEVYIGIVSCTCRVPLLPGSPVGNTSLEGEFLNTPRSSLRVISHSDGDIVITAIFNLRSVVGYRNIGFCLSGIESDAGRNSIHGISRCRCQVDSQRTRGISTADGHIEGRSSGIDLILCWQRIAEVHLRT